MLKLRVHVNNENSYLKKLTFAILVLAAIGCLVLLEYNTTLASNTKVKGVVASGAVKRKIPTQSEAAVYSYRIINRYPHDTNAFTQGLLFYAGFLYESTGIRGQSSLRKVELETGHVLQRYRLPTQFFGEGLALWQGKLIQLTWQGGIGFVYDRETFKRLYSFHYSTEGWGITLNNKYLIMSNGSSTLYFLNPETFQPIRILRVHDGDVLIANLNELEYVKGEIYANVWPTNYIARISPKTGQVSGWINLEGLLGNKERTSGVDVLNGIAYDENEERLFVTGKYWPRLFEIKLIKN